eukprot:87336-Pleurochrysis_carterae.AAC.2
MCVRLRLVSFPIRLRSTEEKPMDSTGVGGGGGDGGQQPAVAQERALHDAAPVQPRWSGRFSGARTGKVLLKWGGGGGRSRISWRGRALRFELLARTHAFKEIRDRHVGQLDNLPLSVV